MRASDKERALIDACDLIGETLKALPAGYTLEMSFNSEDCSVELYDFDGHEVYFDVESNESVVSTAIREASEHLQQFNTK